MVECKSNVKLWAMEQRRGTRFARSTCPFIYKYKNSVEPILHTAILCTHLELSSVNIPRVEILFQNSDQSC